MARRCRWCNSADGDLVPAELDDSSQSHVLARYKGRGRAPLEHPACFTAAEQRREAALWESRRLYDAAREALRAGERDEFERLIAEAEAVTW